MDVIFLWVVGGVAGLLLLAAGVAGWDQLRRSVRPQDEFASATPRAVKVDVRLDKLPTQPAALAPSPSALSEAQRNGDLAQRRAALDNVLARMAQPAGLEQDNPLYWADTTPTVGPGQLDPQDGAAGGRSTESGRSPQP